MIPKGYLAGLTALLASLASETASAQGYSLMTGSGVVSAGARTSASAASFGGGGEPLVRASAEIPDTEAAEAARGRVQSLFLGGARRGLLGRAARGLHEEGPGEVPAYAPLSGEGSRAEMIRHLIARAEAGHAGYDAVQHGARRKPDRPPTEMTLGEIFAWIDATPGQPHAIGRYQFIPATLARLVTILDMGPEARFSPELQDRLADVLLKEAGYEAVNSGEIARTEFMNNLAKIWAGLPNSSGRSHYHGYAGNKATMSWKSFEAEMTRIFQG